MPETAAPGAGLWRAALLGAAAGGRSMSGVAVLALSVPGTETERPARWLAGTGATVAAVLAGAGELVLDKLPATPSRLSPQGLAPRIVLGAFTGAAVTAHLEQTEEPRRLAAPAALAAATALLGALAGARWRSLARRGPLPDWAAALAEDAVVLGLATTACLLRARPAVDDLPAGTPIAHTDVSG
ncbi:DUF4126 family protein [Streptacidiphilus sp. PB12-B1b]|uniref:DUF4126 family protein n=1 Tax=Streptacidiphilus sp. PB12-B1b TaxID=2705012 RepID=UPI0015FDEEBE|nr:DUF4126 family protein [Streptacidiphilus sp. PB12-B1b]QMU76788.1 DUF4126 family protein [Streptacidiphilus sp. PB12-B1b]